MRVIFLFLILQFSYIIAIGNDTDKKLYAFRVWSAEYIFGPTVLLPQYDVTYIGDDINNDYNEMVLTPNGQYQKTSLAGIGGSIAYQIRLTLIEFNKNSTFSLSIFPSLGITVAYGRNNEELGIGHVALPAFLEYNFGTMSTFSFTKNHGITLGLGMEYIIFPLYLKYQRTENYTYNMTDNYTYNRSWIQPSAYFSYKYLNRNGEYTAIILKTGVCVKEEFVNERGIKDSYRNLTFSIGLIQNLEKNKLNKASKKIKKHRNEDIQF
jgi:hypothetical protein